MDYQNETMLAVAYWGSNLVGVVLLLISLKWTRVARVMFAIIFGYASWINYHLSHSNPEAYLDYKESAVGLYALFIEGWFSENITLFVTMIAVGQLLIATGMVMSKTWVTLASVGAIIFLAAIAPLGYYAAFPFSITVSLAAYQIIRKDEKLFIWKKSKGTLVKEVVSHPPATG